MKNRNSIARGFCCGVFGFLFCLSLLWLGMKDETTSLSAAESWPSENLLYIYDPDSLDNYIDEEHHLVVYRIDLYEVTGGASRERVEGRDAFGKANAYSNTDFTNHFSQDNGERQDLSLQYDYYPGAGSVRLCWASATVASTTDYTTVLQVELVGVTGAVRRQISSVYENGWVTVPSVQANTPYAAQAKFSGYHVQFGNVVGSWEEHYFTSNP